MKLGDRVYLVLGLEVEEREVYMIDDKGEPWIRQNSGLGMRANHYLNETYLDVEGAVFAAKSAREREINRLLSKLKRLALNPNVKVRLLKAKTKNGKSGFHRTGPNE